MLSGMTVKPSSGLLPSGFNTRPVFVRQKSVELSRKYKRTEIIYYGDGMSTSPAELTEIKLPAAQDVIVTECALTVNLDDGRTISAPLAWYPRLVHATTEERNNWRISGAGWGVQWPDLDEDISVKGLLAGNPSGESQLSFQRWLESRVKARPHKTSRSE